MKISTLTTYALICFLSFTGCNESKKANEGKENTEEAKSMSNNLPDISGYPIIGTNQTTFLITLLKQQLNKLVILFSVKMPITLETNPIM